MKKLAPHIFRQRLLIEGFYRIAVDKKVIKTYFKEITKTLELRMYGKPIVFSTGGIGKEANQGYDAFVPLVDSGISVYIWSDAKFLSIVIYTCKEFDGSEAIAVTKKFFKIDKVSAKPF